jgi:hypothetical protein
MSNVPTPHTHIGCFVDWSGNPAELWSDSDGEFFTDGGPGHSLVDLTASGVDPWANTHAGGELTNEAPTDWTAWAERAAAGIRRMAQYQRARAGEITFAEYWAGLPNPDAPLPPQPAPGLTRDEDGNVTYSPTPEDIALAIAIVSDRRAQHEAATKPPPPPPIGPRSF